MKDVSRLIDKILAIDDLMPSTREDLEDFKRDIAEGELNRDDQEYIIALHERLIGGGTVVVSDDDDAADDADDDADEEDEAVAAVSPEVAELRQALAERDARIAELERQLAQAGSAGGSTDQSSPIRALGRLLRAVANWLDPARTGR